MYISLQSETLV